MKIIKKMWITFQRVRNKSFLLRCYKQVFGYENRVKIDSLFLCGAKCVQIKNGRNEVVTSITFLTSHQSGKIDEQKPFRGPDGRWCWHTLFALQSQFTTETIFRCHGYRQIFVALDL